MNQVTLEGSTYVLQFDYSPEIIRDVRQLPGRRAEPEQGIWTVPSVFGEAVKEFADRHGLLMESEVQQLAVEELTVHFNGRDFEVRTGDERPALKAITMMQGSIWFQPKECWLVPGAQGMQVNEWAEDHGAKLTEEAEDAVASCQTVEQRYAMSSAKSSDYGIKDGFGLELYDYQLAGIEYVIDVAKGRCIIGDEPGVGKTAQAMGVIYQLDAYPAVIVCPATLKINWRREIHRALPGKSVEILRGTRSVPRLLWADVTILNYDILPNWISNLPKAQAAVLDESHRIKNPEIMRTKASIELLNRVPEDGVALCLTGTAVLNKPNEVMTQLQAIGQIHKFGGLTKARKTYKSNGSALNRKMRETCYIRRKKTDVWVDAPERNWAELVVEGDPHVMAEYRKAEQDIVTYLAERAKKVAEESGATTEAAKMAAWKAALSAEAAQHLVAISHLKQLAARAKMPAAIQWSRNFLESGEKLAVFGWHTETVDRMAEALNAVKIQGGQSEAAREQAKDLFQTKDKVRVLCGQILAAGEGITLTAASNALIMELPWTPGALDQVLDRFHRRGQVNDVVGWLMLVEGTIDLDIQRLIAEKRKIVEETLDGSTDDEDTGGTILQGLVVGLAEKGMK